MGICSLWGELTTWIIHLEKVTSTARPTKQKHRNANPPPKHRQHSTFNPRPFVRFSFFKNKPSQPNPPKIFWPPTVPKNIVALGDQAEPTIDLPSHANLPDFDSEGIDGFVATGGRDGVGLLLVAQYVLGLGTHRPISQRARDQSCCIVSVSTTQKFFLQGFIHPRWLAGLLPSTVWSLDIPVFLRNEMCAKFYPVIQKPKHARIQSFPPSNTLEGCLTQKNWSPKGYCN